MARKSQEEALKTRMRILASALTLFAKKGYEHTTFTDIAARLKLTKGAVYWHFESKEKLLVALVEIALQKFRRQLEGLMPEGELTFPAVCEMMIQNAEQVTREARGTAFFKLMKCQIKWADASMKSVREDLLTNERFSPKYAFIRALKNDIVAGRVKSDVDLEEIAAVCLALWDGLVQSKIDNFLGCEMEKTLRHAYGAIWMDIRCERGGNGGCEAPSISPSTPFATHFAQTRHAAAFAQSGQDVSVGNGTTLPKDDLNDLKNNL
jgi:AcrR family transcriptional regulator